MTAILSLLQATADAAGEFAPRAPSEIFGARALLTQGSYIAASICFMLGLKALTKPETARRGMQLAAVGMLLAVVGTLIVQEAGGRVTAMDGGRLDPAAGDILASNGPLHEAMLEVIRAHRASRAG